MSTHRTRCLMCEGVTTCSNPSSALGVGGGCYDALPLIEFCSIACFNSLRDQMDEAQRRAHRIAAEDSWFQEMLDDKRPAWALPEPTGPVFDMYPKKAAAYIDGDGYDREVVIRARYFHRLEALEFAKWIIENCSDEGDTE